MRLIILVSALFIAACASAPRHLSGPPNLAPAQGAPAPPQALFYADCMAAAAAAQNYDREENTLRFHCTGAVAQRFYEGLGPWSGAHASELRDGGRMLRLTQRPEHDVSGLDFCWRSDAGDYGCTVVLNVGEFLGAE
jgi:hypothetical protein